MDQTNTLARLLQQPGPVLALAPMQDITDLPFWRLISQYGGADLYVTEYFRVYPGSRLDRHILKSVLQNPTNRPVLAQLIGNDIPNLVRTAKELQHHPIAGVDLNLGCPAPVVYRKCAGGGLLRDPARVDAILGALREAIRIPFTVKTRLGFDSTDTFSPLLPIFAKHSLDLLTVHGRTVREMYRSGVHYDLIAEAAALAGCPVLANGNVYSAVKAAEVLHLTGARGVMIGRAAVRNPWLFQQIRQHQQGEPMFLPRGFEVLGYVQALYDCASEGLTETSRVQRIKKFMNFLGIGVDPGGQFLHRIRRARTRNEFFDICQEFLNHSDPMPLEPFSLKLPQADLMAGEHL